MLRLCFSFFIFFFFNDTATTEIYTYCHTLSLHDALPICHSPGGQSRAGHLRAQHLQVLRRLPPHRRALDGTARAAGRLDRIVVRRNRAAVPSDHVNPIYFKRVEQIHRVDGSPKAIPSTLTCSRETYPIGHYRLAFDSLEKIGREHV